MLLGGLFALATAIGSTFGHAGIIVGAVAALGTGIYVYWNSGKLALRAMRARPVGEFEAPHLYRMVREISAIAHQPMPRIYISPTEAPNAFATGRDPGHAAVCFTEGILQILDERELRGVIGHELSHVYNRDILTSTVLGGLASAVMFLPILGLIPIGRSKDGDATTGIFGVLLAILLGPIAYAMIRLSIGRYREYEADVAGAHVTGDPLALASALRKLQAGARALPLPPEPRLEAMSHMLITYPFRPDDVLSRLFSTHPPMAERLSRLERMAGANNSKGQQVTGERPPDL
ncbi:M48 family metalloprotease [Streptomyces sp. NBC_00569]|uniref:M48 family metalloprotease n=1 Tax=Streptomyces sp. NBC_00569 TaxID=2975780 RepID=UPI002E8006E9|nr:M48 family metalloprotease [Streptomyces sp. NBC_00569]WUB99303.1 M48 family metalloprotease [Streptomyces sp. NBC_00569]